MKLPSRSFLFLAAVTSFVLTAPAQSVNNDLRELADSERAFAAFTVREGFRAGFIKFFADDGIGFGPHPQRTKEVLQKRPAETGPRTLIFNWQPMFGDISADGDMGYTTGPVLFMPQGENAKPPWHGIYFSVWEKQTDGQWKVAVDMGVDTPQPVAPIDTTFKGSLAKSRPAARKPEAIDTFDKQFSDSIAKTTPAKAYKSRLGLEFRIHRKGMMPVTLGGELDELSTWPTKFEFIGGKIAKSNDLAFTYGKYAATGAGTDIEEGYYVHVWRTDAAGKWRLVVDVQNPLPKATK